MMTNEKLTRRSARYAKTVQNENGETFKFDHYGKIELESFLSTKRAHRLTNIESGEEIILSSYMLDKDNYIITERRYEPLLDSLWELAGRAHTGTSFNPEKRQEQTIEEHEDLLHEDLVNMPEEFRADYIEKFKEMYGNMLSAKSRCTSTMIAGAANYNVRRHDKVNGWERSASDRFYVWREKRLTSIYKTAENNRRNSLTDAQRFAEDFKPLKQEILEAYVMKASWQKPLLYGFLERRALKGEVELMQLSIDYMTELGEKKGQIFTTRHKIWKLVELATAARERLNDTSTTETTATDMGVCEVVRNEEVDRLQLIFDGKPSQEIITLLKKNGYRWSPRFSAWQRQLTLNATRGLDSLLKSITELSA